MPRRMSAERALLEGLKRVAPNNVLGAINYMPRNMRAMYLHALQASAPAIGLLTHLTVCPRTLWL